MRSFTVASVADAAMDELIEPFIGLLLAPVGVPDADDCADDAPPGCDEVGKGVLIASMAAIDCLGQNRLWFERGRFC